MTGGLDGDSRVDQLLQFSLGMIRGKDGRELLQQYGAVIDRITPHAVVEMEDRQLAMGVSIQDIKRTIGKVINVLNKPLRTYEWNQPCPNSYLGRLMQENRALEERMKHMRGTVRAVNRNQKEGFANLSELAVLNQAVRNIAAIDLHYLKKENILFPYLEKRWTHTRPLQVMWSLDDDCRTIIKQALAITGAGQARVADVNRVMGDMFFLLLGMVMKEELVVFPLATETCTAEDFESMRRQSLAVGFCFIAVDSEQHDRNQIVGPDSVNQAADDLPRGTPSWLFPMLDRLPCDITFVDESDTVRYFNDCDDRIFPRTPAVIGRRVQNCHPPESLDMVNRLLDDFRYGRKDRERFWINLGGQFVLIRYFAVRDRNGSYMGCLEVTEDVTDIRMLKGEKRLLSEDSGP